MHDSDFRNYLEEELRKRCKANPRYSLRAFGRALDIEASALSKVLNGKRRLKSETYTRIADRLGLGPAQVEKFKPDAILKRNRKGMDQTSELPAYENLTDEHFQIIADWYHFAILELTHLKNFNPKLKWISRVLNLPYAEVSAAVSRLKRLDYLEITPDGKWIDRSTRLSAVSGTYTNAAKQKLQKQVLEKSIEALQEVPRLERDHSSMTMAIQTSKLPEARNLIGKFRRELCKLLEGDQTEANQVYHLGISLYPVSRS